MNHGSVDRSQAMNIMEKSSTDVKAYLSKIHEHPSTNHNTQPEKHKLTKPANKSFADIRVKMGEKKPEDKIDADSLPSDLSDDLWGEVPRYQQIVFAQ